MAIRVKEHTTYYANGELISWKIEQLINGEWIEIPILKTHNVVFGMKPQ